MSALTKLESTLESTFNSGPKLSENAKNLIVQYLPWLNLLAGVASLWAAYALWHWAHLVSGLANYYNQLSAAYGGSTIAGDRMSIGLWLGLAIVALEGVLFLMAFPATKARAKRGWNLMFYAALVNLAYGIVLIFTDYGSVGNFIGYAIGTVIGLWILFQIKPKYTS